MLALRHTRMSIKNYILIIFLTSVFSYAHSQTFSKTFVIDSVSTLVNGLVARDSFFFVCGEVLDTTPNHHVASYLTKFDYSANIISSTTIRDPQLAFFIAAYTQNGLLSCSDQSIASVGTATDTAGKDYVLFSRFDSAGNLLFYKTYDLGLIDYIHLQGYSAVQYHNSFYVAGDVQQSNYYTVPILIKLDSTGNLDSLWMYNGLPYMYGEGNSICKLPDSNLLVSIGRTDANMNEYEAVLKTCFLVIDTNGNLLQQYCTPDSNTSVYPSLAVTWDDKYLSAGSFEGNRCQQCPLMEDGLLIKWDTSFNQIWSLQVGDTFGPGGFNCFTQDQGNNIFLCGQNIDSATGYDGALSKVDPAGNLIWFRQYRASDLSIDDSWSYLTTLAMLPDGSILAAGSWENFDNVSPFYYPQIGWIVRVDSNGCLGDGNCGITGINEPPALAQEAEAVRLFPNPSNGVFTVSALTSLPVNSKFEVYNLLGQQIFSQSIYEGDNQVNLNRIAVGVYFFNVRDGLSNVAEGKFIIQR